MEWLDLILLSLVKHSILCSPVPPQSLPTTCKSSLGELLDDFLCPSCFQFSKPSFLMMYPRNFFYFFLILNIKVLFVPVFLKTCLLGMMASNRYFFQPISTPYFLQEVNIIFFSFPKAYYYSKNENIPSFKTSASWKNVYPNATSLTCLCLGINVIYPTYPYASLKSTPIKQLYSVSLVWFLRVK